MILWSEVTMGLSLFCSIKAPCLSLCFFLEVLDVGVWIEMMVLLREG